MAASSRGAALGLALAATAALLVMIWESRNAELLYRDFGSASLLPAVTRFVFGPWRYAAPIAAVASLIVLTLRRPASLAPYVVVGSLALGATAFTWYATRAPLAALVDHLRE